MGTRPKIFLCYAHFDKDKVMEVYNKLKAEDFNPWFDETDLMAGAHLRRHIGNAIKDSDFFIACLTERSVRKRGFVQREIKEALDRYLEFLPDDIWIIPLRLEECKVPEPLSDVRYIDYSNENQWELLVNTIKINMQKRETDRAIIQESNVTPTTKIEEKYALISAKVIKERIRKRKWIWSISLFVSLLFVAGIIALVYQVDFFTDNGGYIEQDKQALLFEDKIGFVLNGDFSSGLDYWSVTKRKTKDGTELTLNPIDEGGLKILLPGDSELKLAQTGIKVPSIFGRNVDLSVFGRINSQKNPAIITLVVKNAQGETILEEEPRILSKGMFNTKLNLTNLSDRLVGLLVILKNPSDESKEPIEIILHKIQIESYVKPNSMNLSLWYRYMFQEKAIFQETLRKDPWSDFFNIYKYREDGSMDSVLIDQRFSADGYTLVENLGTGIYKVEARFLGILYDIKDSIYVTSQKGAFVKLEAHGNLGQIKVKVIGKEGNPVSNAKVKLYTYNGILTYAPEKATGKDGYIPDDLWVWAPGFQEKYPEESYIIEVYRDDMPVGRKDNIKPKFLYTGQRIVETVVVEK